MVAPAICYGVICWGISTSTAEGKRLKLVKDVCSFLGCPLEAVEVVGEGKMMVKLLSLMESMSHPVQDSQTALGSSFSVMLLHPRCVTE